MFITALFILPLLIEGLSSLMHATVVSRLNLGLYGLVAVASPIALVVLRRHLDRRFGRFAWLVSSTVFFGILPLAVLTPMSMYRSIEWGGRSMEWLGVVVVLTAYVLRVVPIIVVARGLYRLVGPGPWCHAIGVLVVVDASLHIALWFWNPALAMRLAVDVVLTVGLLLAAVCSQPAFEEQT